MKVTSRGFEITEIGDGITSIVSDADGSFSILSRNMISGVGEQSANLPAGDIDALIEALQEAKRLFGADGRAERKLVGLKDEAGDLWYAVDGGFSMDKDPYPGDVQTREYVKREWGPVTEVWE